ncbi:copper resistance protein NlpE [Crenothrix sp.]|uniref:copper resistance protein NlpE n=1 Tax=Crenothrix sp. TaxID=3100433 RepID=UPI00374CFDCD
MRALKKQLKQNLAWCIFSSVLFTASSVMAASDREMQEEALKALELAKNPHAAHAATEKGKEFHGVFYGYLPCDDCEGIKATLTFKQNNNYLLVTQPAKASTREFYEKGKFNWNDETHILMLTSNKDSTVRQYHIEAEGGALVQFNADGTPIKGDQESYTLRRGDTIKSRQVHIH